MTGLLGLPDSRLSAIARVAQDLRNGVTTSVELVTQALARIEHDDGLGAVVGRCDEAALAAAQRADRERALGIDRGALHGIPIGLKDVLATVDAPTTGQSLAMLPGYQDYDSAAAGRLRTAGAVIVAKASCSEFACGTPDPEKPFAPPRNPWDRRRWAGGSSGGSASGLLAGFFLGSVGTDTGGSIRVPAAFSGITGLKPSAGLIPTFGCVPLSTTMDHIGPMARTAADCAMLLGALAHDGASHPVDYTLGLDADLAGVRIGVETDLHRTAGVPGPLTDLYSTAVEDLRVRGAYLVEVNFPYAAEVFAAARVVIAGESLDVHRANLASRWNDYGRPTRLSLSNGAFYSAADLSRAKRVITAVRPAVAELFRTVDCLASLTCPMVAWQLDQMNAEETFKAPLFTNRWNALGMPALSVPIGMVPTAGAPLGLPVGMQIAAAAGRDDLVLKVGHAYQSATGWHEMQPPGRSAA